MYVLVKYFVYFIWIASQFSAFFVVLNMFVLIGDWIGTYVNHTVATVLIKTLSLVLLENTVVYCNSVYLWPSATTNGTVMLMVLSSAMNSISLTWSVSSSASATGYFISFKRTDIPLDLTPQWVFIEATTTSHTLSNLLGGTNYGITLRLVDNFGVSTEESTNARTSEGSKCMV